MSPADITAIVMASAAVIAALTPIITARRKKQRENSSTTLAGFTKLNDALTREVERRDNEMERMRDDYEARISRLQKECEAKADELRSDYEVQLSEARKRITELESEVATLNRLLSRRRTNSS